MIDKILKTLDFIPPKEISFWDKIIFFDSFNPVRKTPEYFFQIGILFFAWFVVGTMLFVWYMDGKHQNYKIVLYVGLTVWVLFIFALGKITGALVNPLNLIN